MLTPSVLLQRTAGAGAVADRGDITNPPATSEAACSPAAPAAPAVADADNALRPVNAPAAAALAEVPPPFGDPSAAVVPPAATPTDSASLCPLACSGWVAPPRCLRCCASVCCSRWLTTNKGLVGELSTVSFTLMPSRKVLSSCLRSVFSCSSLLHQNDGILANVVTLLEPDIGNLQADV